MRWNRADGAGSVRKREASCMGEIPEQETDGNVWK